MPINSFVIASHPVKTLQPLDFGSGSILKNGIGRELAARWALKLIANNASRMRVKRALQEVTEWIVPHANDIPNHESVL